MTALRGLGSGLRQLDAHPSNMTPERPLGRWRAGHCLDRRFGLLHHYSVAVLRRQCAVFLLSELVARWESVWAIELTRHPRSKQVVLPCENWLGDPFINCLSVTTYVNCTVLEKAGRLTISSTRGCSRLNGAIIQRNICRKHPILAGGMC